VPNVGKTRATAPIFDDVFINDEDVTEEITDVFHRLKIDANNLADEAVDHPSLFARIAVLAEEASSEARFARRRLDLAKAALDGKIRRESSVDGGKKPTEPQIENMVVTDPEITDLTEAWLDSERCAGIVSAIRQSLTHRREMLVELMRDRRHENASYTTNE